MIDRRRFLLAAAVVPPTAVWGQTPKPGDEYVPVDSRSAPPTIRFSLNTSTLRGQKLTVPEQIEVVKDAGYDAIEPWMRDIDAFVQSGGRLRDLRSMLDDRGLRIAGGIGFAQWIVDDAAQRAAGLETARRDMATLAMLGGTNIAAPPIGKHTADDVSPPLEVIAERYRALCEVGAAEGVAPQLEVWGFSPTLHRLADVAYVVTAAAHPMASVLPDFYHLYKGGNDFASLGMIEASRMPCFHINDYPSDPPRELIGDADRVFPGDGVCPLVDVIAMLIGNGFAGAFSLELFNRDYWKRDAADVAAEGLRKSRAVVEAALNRVATKQDVR